jgi:hypothetical protein
MVITRAGGNALDPTTTVTDEELRAAELARAQEQACQDAYARELPDPLLESVPNRFRLPDVSANLSPRHGTPPEMAAMMQMMSAMHMELSELRKKRRGSGSDSEESDPDLHQIPPLFDPTHELPISEVIARTYRGIQPATCHDPRFRKALDYRYYRLNRRSSRYDGQIASRIARLTRQMEASFKMRFSGADPIAVIQFLHSFVDAANTNGVREGAALHILRSFLDTPARDEFIAYRATSFPGAVDWLLATFAPVGALASEYKSISSMTQRVQESPRAFSLRLRQRASRLGPLMDEAAVTVLLEGLDPSVSGFVQSALRQQKPTFTNVLQEAELVFASVQATEARVTEKSAPNPSRPHRPAILARTDRGLPEYIRPRRESPSVPVLAAEFLGEGYQYSLSAEPTSDEMEQILTANLAPPQQVRCCYTCWRPGHFSAQCPLIPESERAGIAQRRSEVMRKRSHMYQSRSLHPVGSAQAVHEKSVPDTVLVAPQLPVLTDPTVGVREELSEKKWPVGEATRPNGSL